MMKNPIQFDFSFKRWLYAGVMLLGLTFLETGTLSAQCPPGAVCDTLTSGDIASDFGVLPPNFTACFGSMDLVIPTGNWIDSISTSYDVTAGNGAWMSEQRSWLYSPTTGAGEATAAAGSGTTGGTFSYNRTGLTVGQYGFDTVTFEMHLGRTWGGSGCDASYNKVDNGTWVVIAYYSPVPSCLPALGVSAANVTANGANFSWNTVTGAVGYEYEVRTSGMPGSGAAGLVTSGTVTSNTTAVSGLNSSTSYSFYVRTDCGSSTFSNWSAGFSWTTPFQGPQGLTCTVGSPGPIFADDFESQGGWTGNIGSGSQASNWNYNSGGTGSFGTGPLGAHSNNFYLYTETSGTPSGANIEGISPRIDLSTSFNSAELSFWLHAHGSGIDSIMVQVGTSPSGPWSTVFTQVGQLQSNQGDPWQNVGVNLDSYVGSAIHLRFLVVHGSGFAGDVAIDLVEVNSCQTCPNPGNPNLAFISNDSASFSWSGSGTGYGINWGPRGFTQGSAASNFDSTTTNSFGLGGLMGNTAYDIYFRNDCSDSANGFSGWVGPLTFITECDPFTAPYANNFDNDSLLEAPACWDNLLIGTGTQFSAANVISASTFDPAHSAPNHVRFYNYNNDTTWLISPQFSDLTVDTNRISFFARTTSSFGAQELVVGTVASPGNPASFSPIDTITLTSNYTQYNLDITTANGYNGTHEYIVLEHAAANNFVTYYIDNFVYEGIPPCNPPLISSLGVNFVTATSAEVAWGANSDGDTTFVEWGTPGFTPGLSNIGSAGVSGSVDSYLITGLTAETDYEFYVLDSCSGSGTSPYVGPFAFRTGCALATPVVLPLLDGFENYTQGPDFTTKTDLCNPGYSWTFTPGGNGRARLQAGTTYYRTGAQAMTLDQGNFNASGATNYLDLTVNLSSYITAGGITLSFYYMNHANLAHPDNRVWVRGSPNDPWIQIVDLDASSIGNGVYDSIIAVDIVAPITGAGQTIGANTQIRFGQHGTSSTFSPSFGDGFTFDDVLLEAVTCPKPAQVMATNISNTNVTLDWSASSAATQYQYWFGPNNFYQGTTTNAGVKVFTTADTAYIDTVSPATCYEFLVRNICGPGDTSDWSGPVKFCTSICVASSQCWFYFDLEDSFGDGWNGGEVDVKQNGITVATLGSNFSTGSLYKDSVLLCDGFPTTVEVSAAGGWPSEMGIKVMAPYGDTVAVYTNSPTTAAGTIMASFNSGCTAPTCDQPSGLVQQAGGLTTIDVAWTSNAFGTSWELEYGPVGFTPGAGTSVITATNPHTITGLTAATAYDVYVREICGPGDTSFLTGPVRMNTTLCSAANQCWVYFDLEDSFGDGWNGATIDVVQNGVVVGTLGQNFTTGSLYQDSLQLCDLLNTAVVLSNAGGWPSEVGVTVNSSYNTQFGQYLANPATSQGDTLLNFVVQCTPPTCPQPTNLVVNSVTGTTANVGWTNGGSGTAWEIEYNAGGFTPGNGTRVAAGTNPFTLTGLSGSSSYTFYVREICGPADTSLWSGPVNFSTACIAVMAPYSTDFENIPIGQADPTTNSWNNCWTTSGSGPRWESEDASGSNENSLNTGPFNDATLHPSSGGTYMYLETSTGAGIAELVSPEIDITPLTAPELVFAYHMYGATINKLVVYAEDANGLRTALDSIVGQQQTAGSDSFYIRNVSLSSLAAGNYRFVFEGHRGTSFTGDIAIDEVSVNNVGSSGPSPCPVPTMVMSTANVGCDSIEVSWMSNTGGSIIQYGPAGFTPGTGTFTGVVTSPFTITGLSANTAYDIWVADTCAGDTSSYTPFTDTTANAPLPTASFTVTDTIIGNQYRVIVDASGSSNATSYSWDYGNGVTGSGMIDTTIYLGNGVYTITLTASNGCGSSTDTISVNVNIGLEDNPLARSLNVYPNPASYQVNVSFREVGSGDVVIRLRDASGREVMNIADRLQSGTFDKDIDVSGLAKGVYMLEVQSGELNAHRRLTIR